jgi:hypothetical protein
VSTRLVLPAGVLLAVVVACGRTAERQPEAPSVGSPAAPAAPIVSQGHAGSSADRASSASAQALPLSFQQLAAAQPEPVSFEALKTALPTIEGWTQSHARGEQLAMPMKYSRVEAWYSRGDNSIELEIVDSARSPLLLSPVSMFLQSGYAERSEEGFKRAISISGHPAVEQLDADSQSGEIVAIVAGRFIVQASGHDIADLTLVREVVDAVDLTRLASFD